MSTQPRVRSAGPRTEGVQLVTLGGFECHGTSGRLAKLEAEPLLGGLLAYLAVNRRASVQELAQLFFRQDRQSVDLILPVVRSIQEQAGPGVLHRMGTLIAAADTLMVDVRGFEASHRDGDYGSVVRSYRGAFLPNAERIQGEQFSRWVHKRRARYAALHVEARERAQVCQTFEAIGDEVLLVSWRGVVLHRSPGMETLLNDCAGGAALLSRIQRLGREVAAGTDGPCTLDVPCGARRLRISAVAMPDTSGDPVCVVVVRPLGTDWPPPRALRSTFGLTRRQARVAMLIAEGHANAEVADALSISPHTARRHTEAVLEKLGLRYRSGVAARVLTARSKRPL